MIVRNNEMSCTLSMETGLYLAYQTCSWQLKAWRSIHVFLSWPETATEGKAHPAIQGLSTAPGALDFNAVWPLGKSSPISRHFICLWVILVQLSWKLCCAGLLRHASWSHTELPPPLNDCSRRNHCRLGTTRGKRCYHEEPRHAGQSNFGLLRFPSQSKIGWRVEAPML